MESMSEQENSKTEASFDEVYDSSSIRIDKSVSNDDSEVPQVCFFVFIEVKFFQMLSWFL